MTDCRTNIRSISRQSTKENSCHINRKAKSHSTHSLIRGTVICRLQFSSYVHKVIILKNLTKPEINLNGSYRRNEPQTSHSTDD